MKVSDLKWERICRLDSPFIEEMLEKYGSAVSRIGTIDINQNTYQLSKSLDQLTQPKKKSAK